MPTALRLLPALSPDHRARLMSLAREVSFPADGKIFEAGGTADRFWVVRSGTVSLHQRVVGERRISVATLGPGDLLGWSWLFPPHHWDFAPRRSVPYARTSSMPRRCARCATRIRPWSCR